jgi:hypothetical protein
MVVSVPGSIYKRLIQIGKVAGAISFLIAAPYALIQYLQAKEATQVEQTLKIYQQYNSSPFMGYREKVSKALIKNKAKMMASAANPKDFETAQLQVVQEGDIETELFMLFDFFDGVTVCVITSICDNDTAIRLFKPRALDIYLSFYQYMMIQRETSATKDFGGGLEAIAKSGTPLTIGSKTDTTGGQNR